MKKLSLILFPVILIFLVFLTFTFGKDYIIYLFGYIEQNKENYILILFVNTFYCLISLPVTPLIIANGFFIGTMGFFYIYLAIILSSTILYLTAKKFSKILRNYKFIDKKIFENSQVKKFLNISNQSLIFFLLRYTLPFFVHNLFYGLSKISNTKFIILVSLSEIPFTYALYILGMSLKELSFESLDLTKVFLSKNFLLPLFFIVIFTIIVNYILKKIKK